MWFSEVEDAASEPCYSSILSVPCMQVYSTWLHDWRWYAPCAVDTREYACVLYYIYIVRRSLKMSWPVDRSMQHGHTQQELITWSTHGILRNWLHTVTFDQREACLVQQPVTMQIYTWSTGRVCVFRFFKKKIVQVLLSTPQVFLRISRNSLT